MNEIEYLEKASSEESLRMWNSPKHHLEPRIKPRLPVNSLATIKPAPREKRQEAATYLLHSKPLEVMQIWYDNIRLN